MVNRPYVRKFALLFFFIVPLSKKVVGQNYSLYNGYFLNAFTYNPAAAATERLAVNASYRRQWVEIPNAPSVSTLTANTLIDNTRAGIGLKVSSISRGFLNSTDFSLSYAYGIPLNRESHLFFGISGGVLSNSLNLKDLAVINDPALNTLSTSLIPTVSFGMLYKNNNGLNVGFSLPKLVNSQNLDANYSFSFADNLIVSASFSKWNPTPKFVKGKATKSYGKPKKTINMPLEVFSLYRYSNLYGSLFEATARYNFNKSVWLSGTYRQYQGIIPGLGATIDNVSISYFYELGLGGDLPLRTHEVLLTVKLGKDKKYRDAEPVQTISKNGSQPNQIANKGLPKNTQTPVLAKKETPTLTTLPKALTTPPVKKEPEVPNKNTNVSVKNDTARAHKPRLQKSNVISFSGDSDSLKVIHENEKKELDAHIEEHADGKHDDTHNEPVSQRHEFVKRGTHQEELAAATYVIGGAFQSKVNAEHYVKTLKSLGYSADFGHLSVRNIWYVFIADEVEIPEARKERDRLQKNKIFSKVWLLTVQE